MKHPALAALVALTGLGCAPPPAAPPTARAQVSGRLPVAVIQSVVNARYDRYRACYEAGLHRDPKLKGRASTHFVIGQDGAISDLRDAGSDLPDKKVISCVMSAYEGLTFPPSGNGVVTVVYPIMFALPNKLAATKTSPSSPGNAP